ncbi:unnamed protein product [Darwinula stevensoni]|uniref:C1q domain-containing protein n=1 Tax=Darwinula stevensoni TaxID=69355 RepID=A0A7R9AGZ6_9CRUS|nr:unnamed protein product [Darwinula stevensoni]CAG0904343.1 unnamed protein product [Darwinula stevensoni]
MRGVESLLVFALIASTKHGFAEKFPVNFTSGSKRSDSKDESKLSALIAKAEEHGKRIARLEVDSGHLWHDNENLKRENDNLKRDNENAMETVEGLKDDNENLKRGYEDLKREFQKLENDFQDLKHERENLTIDLRILKLDNENLRLGNAHLKFQLLESLLERDNAMQLQQEAIDERLQYLEATTLQIAPRTCQTFADLGVQRTGTYFVDPDGPLLGDPPIKVRCDMETDPVSTIVAHDSMEIGMVIVPCADPGCFRRRVTYDATLKQMVALINQSHSCEQQITYDCISAALSTGDTQNAWWVDRHGQPQSYWHGSGSTNHTCRCGLLKDCTDPNLLCNCNAESSKRHSDSGTITNATALPVTELRFGGMQLEEQEANYTLGGLVCRGQAPHQGNPASSCSSLRKAGNTRTGYHLISRKGGRLDVVLCQMDLEETDPEFQVETGARIPDRGVYFNAYRKSPWNIRGTVEFEGTEVNIGNAMDSNSGIFIAPFDGTYAFILHYLTNARTDSVELRRNGTILGRSYSRGENYRMSGQSILLDLKRGDRVQVHLENGELFSNDNRFVHFVGFLLYP